MADLKVVSGVQDGFLRTHGFENRSESSEGPSLDLDALDAYSAPSNPFDLTASRYENLSTGTWLEWSFETQTATPIDGANASARKYSPFILRLVPPLSLVPNIGEGVDVNLIGRAGDTQGVSLGSVVAGGSQSGATLLSGTLSETSGIADLDALQQIVSAGQVITSVITNTGEEISTLVDIYTLADISAQMLAMAAAPPLGLLVNPSEFSISYESIQEYSNRSREGYIFQRWGEGQPTLSISGSTGSFMTAYPPGTLPEQAGVDIFTGLAPFPRSPKGVERTRTLGEVSPEGQSTSGVQWASRRESAAFQNFQSLYLLYRNNGYIYDNVRKTCAHLGVGAVAIDYDQKTYIGHIESFNYSFQDGMPHRLEWSMEFIVDMEYDHAVAPAYVAPMTGGATPTVAQGINRAARQKSSVAMQAERGSSPEMGRAGFGDSTAEAYAGTPEETFGESTTDAYNTQGVTLAQKGLVLSGGAAAPVSATTTGVYPFNLLGNE